jgi:hypothetical protein
MHLRPRELHEVGISAASVWPASASTASAQRPDRNEQPIVRSFNRFSYVAGNDIQRPAAATAATGCAWIYNAIYDEQVRTYEIFLQPDGTAGMTAASGRSRNVTNSDPRWRDVWLLAMRRGERSSIPRKPVSHGVVAVRAGPRRPAPAGCRFLVDGRVVPQRRMGLPAYHYPTDGFANVKFAAKLFSWDTVPVPVNPPRKLVPAELRRDPNAPVNHMKANQWTLTVGKDGLRPR